jgi:hypothetical protein
MDRLPFRIDRVRFAGVRFAPVPGPGFLSIRPFPIRPFAGTIAGAIAGTIR